MNVSSASSVMSYLQQQASIQKQHNELDANVAESITRARQDAVDRTLEENNKISEQVSEIKRAAVKAQGGGIDVWA